MLSLDGFQMWALDDLALFVVVLLIPHKESNRELIGGNLFFYLLYLWCSILLPCGSKYLKLEDMFLNPLDWSGLWTSLLRQDWKKGSGCFIPLLRLLLFGNNVFFLFLLLGLHFALDFAFLLSEDPLNLLAIPKVSSAFSSSTIVLASFFFLFCWTSSWATSRIGLFLLMSTFIAFKLTTLKCCCLAMKVSLLIMDCLESSSVLSKKWKT